MKRLGGTKSGTPEYGHCKKKGVDLYTWSGQCTPQNQECFIHRKDQDHTGNRIYLGKIGYATQKQGETRTEAVTRFLNDKK